MNSKILATVGCGIALGLCASAATPVVWVGGTSGNLSEASNWDPEVVPQGKTSDYVAVFTNAVSLTYDYSMTKDWYLAGMKVAGAVTVTIVGDKQAIFASSACATGGFVVDVAEGGVLDASQGYFYAQQMDFVKKGAGMFRAGRRFGFSTANYIRTLDVQEGTLEDVYPSTGQVRVSEKIRVGSGAVLKCYENGIATTDVSPYLVVEKEGSFDGNGGDQILLGVQGEGKISRVNTLNLDLVHSGLVFGGKISAETLSVTNSASTAAGAFVVFGSDDTLQGVKALTISRDATYSIPDVRFAAGIGEFLIGGGTWPTDRTFVDLDGMPVTLWRMTDVRYVDDDNYGKSGDGTTPEKAYGTLKEALEAATAYTLVRVLPGTYDKGEMTGANDSTPCRAIVPGKARLVAVGSPEETIIKGARSTDASCDALGNGPGGVRCVRLSANSTMRGFTLTDGHVARTSLVSDDNGAQGGGVSASTQGTIISDCIITNNAAVCGAAGDNGSFVRCRVLDNHATRNDGVAFYGSANLYGCIIDGNATGSNQNSYYSSAAGIEIRNCTFGPDETVSISVKQETEGQRAFIYNTVILGGIANPRRPTGQYRNCVLACAYADKVDKDETTIARTDLETVAEKLSFAGLDAGLRPVKDSVLTDRGVNVYFETVDDATSKCYGGKDLDGCTRVRNGTIDIGACEYDCRLEYADLVGKAKKMPIIYMSAGVVTNSAGAVCLQDQDVVKASAIMPGSYSISVRVVGDGELSVLVGDSATVQTVREQDGTVELPLAVEDSPVPVRFAFEGTGHAELLHFDCPKTGLMLIFR